MIYRVVIEPLSAFFLGHNSHARKGAAIVHSDVLHAALVNLSALAGFSIINAAKELRVSSLFPCWENIYFYPRPFLRIPTSANNPPTDGETSSAISERKRLKSLRWVSQGVLDAWLSQTAEPFLGEHIKKIGEDAWVLADEVEEQTLPEWLVRRGSLKSVVPAMAIDRFTNAATPYERRNIQLNTKKHVRAYFLAKVPDIYKAEFEKLVELLGEVGLGGERNLGYGHFTVAFEPSPQLPWLSPPVGGPTPNAFYTLSLYLPTEKEVADGVLESPAAYDCTIREGWIHDHGGTAFFKKSTRMCLEGSVFRCVADQHGEIRDVRPDNFKDHEIWRCGYAFEFFFHYKDA